ncbi:hypothetical protein KVR01_013221 [Diaporthe batatas]|uniref:uncharacterized protein n=1 Tax=Diaporthe batatas TaxID=748121 RepID=UPI001D054878|nr:uncharacterized protein KVR01_013221 [Diaporthe batatas]KAG8156999.1 hypothetical protein KVR01_013221 [Diaporthe batatas]
MCVMKYPAHRGCKHPDKITFVGRNWTELIEIELCRDAELASRHELGRGGRVRCEDPGWQAEVDPDIDVWCVDCENEDDYEWSAENMCGRFANELENWRAQGILDEQELGAVRRDIDRALRRHRDEANGPRGPYNNSYYVLQEALETFMAYWDQYITDKRARMEEEEAWRLARVGNRVDEALETSVFPPGYLAQAEEARARDESRQFTRRRRPGRLAQFFGGGRSSKR